MNIALLTFSDGSTLQVKENQRLIPVVSLSVDGSVEASIGKSFELWNHIHDGLFWGLHEFLTTCSFFYLLEDNSIIYRSDSVIKIQKL